MVKLCSTSGIQSLIHLFLFQLNPSPVWMVILNFLTEKVRKYQEKKLNDALQKIKLHQEIEQRLKIELKTSNEKSKVTIEKEISKQNESIEIWKKNVVKIKKEIAKL